MASNVVVTGYYWAESIDDITFLHFDVYKKGLFGGVKKNLTYDGWALLFKHLPNGDIDVNTTTLQDGGFSNQKLIKQLAYSILLAGVFTLKEKNEPNKAEILRRGAMDFYKNIVLFK